MSRISPKYLPQINAPYRIILDKLDGEGIVYDIIEVNPDTLTPLQLFTLSDDVCLSIIDDMHPVWIDNDLNILDGHHKWMKALQDGISIKAVRVDLNERDAARVLNKIQDIYEYEQSQGLEEVEIQDTINHYGDDENQFLDALEEDNLALQTEETEKNQQTIIAYRREPIKENSVVGNFFTLNPINGYSKYEINFDNLLDTNALGVTYKDSQEPVDILAKSWFPHINFEKLSNQYNVPSSTLKNKAVAEKAMKMGYDGIKYGETLIQGLK